MQLLNNFSTMFDLDKALAAWRRTLVYNRAFTAIRPSRRRWPTR